ncbi:MAG: ROK family protein [Cellulomonadaceae bacterium]|jgi:polyphosphate glucokinase|nr:ROK family protein [Cellulomonadaceae bacterium]
MLVTETLTLAVDCGGGGIKANVLDASGTAHASPVRVPTPYPLPPTLLVDTVADIASGLPSAHRVTVGMPGMIRHGVVIHTPHYITRSGPRSLVVPELAQAWATFDMQAAVTERLGIPALVLNDAEVHGAGVVTGSGVEFVMTLGTGLGTALFDGGRLAPHLEWSHAPIRLSRSTTLWVAGAGDQALAAIRDRQANTARFRPATYDEFIGEPERQRLGDSQWSRRVLAMVEGLRPVFWWDRLYIGGGNSRLISPTVLGRLGDDVVVVPNSAALVGGARAWDLLG